ncbi:MAG: Lrp/AsnC family transcriptional regulator, partial [Cloacibacillus sp.]
MKRPPEVKTDEIDFKMAEILQHNSRISYKNLGETVGLSTPAVFERMRKLEEKGVIQGYNTDIDYCKLGYSIHAFILLSDDRCTDGTPKILDGMENIYQFWMVSGSYDYMLEVYLANNRELNDLLDELYKIGR